MTNYISPETNTLEYRSSNPILTGSDGIDQGNINNPVKDIDASNFEDA